MTLSPGTRLGPYEIEAPLGAGGMGEVYRAKDTRLDRTVAVKILPALISEEPRYPARPARVGPQQTGTQVIDSVMPAPGKVSYFLVGVSSSCGSTVSTGSGGNLRNLPTCAPNVVVNGDMESWTTPTDLTDWSENAPGGLVEQETNPAHVYEQLSAARVTRSAAGGLTIQKTGIMLQPGADYVLSFEAKFDQVFTNPMIVRVFNLTAGQDLQSDGSWAASGHTAFFDVSTSYQKISIPFTVDPGFSASDDIRLVIGHRGATPVGSMLWIDDVRITE